MEHAHTVERPIKVLMVEDETLISEWVTETLIEEGFDVLAAATAREALELLMRYDPDVLFTDINLPGGMDGSKLARVARRLRPGLTVVYASGRVHSLDPDACVPGSTFIPKPYMPSQVSSLLARVVTADNRDRSR